MKKSLIALAVAGTFAAPAFAATSNVDVYGKLHVGVSVLNDQVTTAEDVQVSSYASRIGFKGSEDLGGGMKAVWQIESGVDLDDQTGTLSNRNSFVGLAGGFGTVLIGNHDTPFKGVGRAVDLFGDTIGDSRNVLGGGGDTRARNTVAYMSPDMSGFSLALAYSNDAATAAATTGDATNNELWSASVAYANGPIYVGLGYADGDAMSSDEAYRIAGSYSFGDFKVVASFEDRDNHYDGWMLGGAYKMGPMTFKLNYMQAEQDATSAETDQWNIGVDYALSKRTTVYAMYTSADAEFSVHSTGFGLGTGAGGSDRVGIDTTGGNTDISAFTVGVVHTF